MTSTAQSLIYDWNPPSPTQHPVQICDETLRDGLQGSIPVMPSIEERLQLLSYSDRLQLSEAVVGFPAQPHSFRDALAICQGAQAAHLTLPLGLLGRMVPADIDAIDAIRQRTGHPVVAWLFVGCSPIRRYAETRDIQQLQEMTRCGIRYAKTLGLPVNFGTEDTSRAEPDVIEQLFQIAIDEGAETVSICDTVGHLTPPGTERLVRHFRTFLDDHGYATRLDFHAHNDRGLGVANGLAAAAAGIDRIHCTIFGIGERSGNIPLDQLLVNFKLQGRWSSDIAPLKAYCQAVQEQLQVAVADHYPIFGRQAFLTQAGVHASTILKAQHQGDRDVAALVYSGVDPHLVGLDYGIQVGPHSGHSNVRFILERLGLEATPPQIEHILTVARQENRILANAEVQQLVTQSPLPTTGVSVQ